MEALGYVKSAIDDYQHLLERKQAALQDPNVDGVAPEEDEINYFSLLQSLSIAHFNEGVEHEHLKAYAEALDSYERSRDFALQVQVGSGCGNDAMLVNAERSIQEVAVKLQASEEIKAKRVTRRGNLDTMRLFRDTQHLKNIDNLMRERLEGIMQSVIMRVSKDSKDERSIQNWNERIGRQFKDYSRFFFKRPAKRFKSPFSESPLQSESPGGLRGSQNFTTKPLFSGRTSSNAENSFSQF
jgi:hypothetical protein